MTDSQPRTRPLDYPVVRNYYRLKTQGLVLQIEALEK